MYKRILVSTDGSELSAKAVNSAIDLAKLSGAELVAMTVVVPTGVSYWDGTTRHAMEESSRNEDIHEDSARAIVVAVKEAAQAKGVTAQAITIKSELIAESLISAAQKYDCDLIVMASHGRRGVNRILLGSETLNVLTQTKIPVLVLR